MIEISKEDLLELKKILGNLYLDNRNTYEVLLLSEAVDKIIESIQKDKLHVWINTE